MFKPVALAALTTLASLGCAAPHVATTDEALDQTVLGDAQSFAVLGASTVTSTGPTLVEGNLGLSPGLEVTGFPPGLVTGGTIHRGDAEALHAQDDATFAYVTLAGQTPTLDLSGQDLGGMTLTPGIYSFSSSAQLTGTLTLDAQHDPDAVFVFQIGSTLTTQSGSSVVIIDGPGACNIYWQVGSSATLGSATAFQGTIVALTSITLVTGASVNGRVLARNGAVTLDSNAISPLACGTASDGADAGTPEDVDAGLPMDAGPSIDAPAEAGL